MPLVTHSEHRPSKQSDECRRWIEKADEDIASARLLATAEPPLLGIAAYHCQQAAEKLLKAVLVASGRPVRKTHYLNEHGLAVIEARPDLASLVEPLRPRTTWGFVFRYPSADEELAGPPPCRAEITVVLGQIEALRSAVVASLIG